MCPPPPRTQHEAALLAAGATTYIADGRAGPLEPRRVIHTVQHGAGGQAAGRAADVVDSRVDSREREHIGGLTVVMCVCARTPSPLPRAED